MNCPVCGEHVPREDLLRESGCNDGEPQSEFELTCEAGTDDAGGTCGARFEVHTDWDPCFTAGKVL